MARNYNKDLIKHIEELMETVSELKQEIKDLKIAHALEVKELTSEIAGLKVENEKLRKDNNRLKVQLSKNSSNSSKPPRTDNFQTVMNSRESSNRKAGGQKGHIGARLKLPENIEELIQTGEVIHEIVDNTDGSETYISRYELDTKTMVIVREHRFSKREDIPNHLYNEVSYGDEIKAQTMLFTTEGLIARKRLSGIFSALTNGVIEPSTGTLNNFMNLFNRGLEASGQLEQMRNDVLNAEVIHVDDTVVKTTQRIQFDKEDPQKKIGFETKEKGAYQAYLRTYSTPTTTFFTVNPGKGNDGVLRDNILPNFTGVVAQDFEAKFRKYGTSNSFCHAHLDRENKGLVQLYNCDYANKFRELFNQMNTHKKNDVEQGITKCDEDKLAFFEATCRLLVSEAYTYAQTIDFGKEEFLNIVKRLEAYEDGYLLFMRNYKLPFTNNLAERDLRMEKQQQKISGAHRSWDGLEKRAKARSLLSTVKKRGFSIFKAIKLTLKGLSALEA